jgi:hypothetical protein
MMITAKANNCQSTPFMGCPEQQDRATLPVFFYARGNQCAIQIHGTGTRPDSEYLPGFWAVGNR